MQTKTHTSLTLLIASVTLLFLGALIPTAHAVNTWDGGAADGNWNSPNNWDNNAVPGASSSLTFIGSTQTTTTNNISSGYTAAAITFTNNGTNATSGFTLAGSSIVLGGDIVTAASSLSITDTISLNVAMSGNRAFSAGTNHHLVISGLISQVSGTRSLTKSGDGTLTLQNAGNSFSGVVNINAGTITVDSSLGIANTNLSSALGAGSSIKLGNAGATGTLNFASGAAGTDRQVTVGGTAATGAGGATINNNSSNGSTPLVFSNAAFNVSAGAITTNRVLSLGGTNTDANQITGVISDNNTAGGGLVSVTKAGSGLWILSGSNTYTGATTVNAGTLQLGASDRISDSSALTVAGGSFDLSSFNDTVASLTQTGGTLAGTGTLTAATYALQGGTINAKLGSGIVTVSTGTTTLGSGARLNSSSALVVNSGQLTLGGNETVASLAGSGGSVALGANNLTASGNNTSTTFSGALVGSGGSLTKAGNGTVVLSGSNTYTGATTVNAGTLQIGASDRISDSSALTIAGGSFDLSSFNDTVASLTQTNGTLAGTGTLTAATYALQGGTVTGNLGAGTATVTVGTTTLNGTLGAGTVNVNGGTLNLGSTNRLADSAAVTVAGGTLGMGTLNDTVGSFTMTSGTLDGSTGILTAGSYALQGGTINAKLGSGTVTVGSGTTTLGSGARLNSSSALVVNSGQLTLGGNETVASLAGSGGSVALGANNLTASGNGTSTTFSGTLVGSGGSLTKAGNGTVVLSGSNTYTGATTVSGGKLVMSGTNISSAVTVSSGASLGGSGQVGALSVSGTLAPGNSVGTLSAGNTTFNGGGAFQLEMYDWTGSSGIGWDLLSVSGDLTLTNMGSPFTINLVSMSSTNTAGNSINWNANANWTNAFVSYSGSLLGDAFSTSMFSVDASAFQNLLNGTFSVITNGSVLSLLYTTSFVPSSTFTWTTNSGAWSDGANWAGSTAPANGADVLFAGAGGVSTNNAVTSLNGMAFSNAAGSYTVTGGAFTNSSLGIVNNSSSAQSVNNDIALGSAQTFNAAAGNLSFGGAIDNGGFLLSVEGGGNTVVSGTLSGSGGLAKLGSGTLSLSGANTYLGGTLVSAGALSGDTTSLQGAITNNASVVFSQTTNGTYAGALGGSGSLVKSGSGTVVLTGANSQGGTTISGGTLQIGSGGTSGALGGAITNNGTLAFNRSDNVTQSNAITGTGNLTKAGNGTLTLSGANAYSGGTLVSAGALSGDTTSLQGAITNNASVVFSQTTNGTYAGALGGSGSLVKVGTGTLALSGASTYSGGTLVSAGTLSGSTTSLQGAITNNAAVVINQTDNGTYSGAMSGSGALNKSGTGTVTLGGNNSAYAGAINVQAGGLVAANNNALGSAAVNMTNGSIQAANGVSIANNFTIGYSNGVTTNFGSTTTLAGWDVLSGSAGVTNLAGSGSSGVLASNLTLGTGVTTGTITNAVGGSGWNYATAALAVAANRFMGFGLSSSDSNTVLKLTTLDPFYYRASGSGPTNATLQYSLNGGSSYTDLFSTNYTNGSVNLQYGSIDLSSQGSVLQAVGTNGVLFRWVNYGASGGSGSWYLRDGSAAGNDLVINGQLGTLGSLYSGTGTIGINEAGSATFSGSITNNSAATLTAVANGIATFSGIVSGAGSITKSGSGMVILSGANTYSGATTVSAGALRVSNNTALGTTAGGVTVADGAVLEMQGGITVGAEALNLSGTGISSGGALRSISGDNTYGGTITNTLASRINSDSGTLTLSGAINATNQALTFGGAGNISVSGAITNSTSTLTKDGSGTLTLVTAATHSGGTTLSSGTLRIGTNNPLGTGTLSLNGGILSGNDTSARTLTNNVSIGGNVGFGDGTSTAALTLSGTVDVGAATRTLTVLNSTTLSGTVGGSGGLVKAGTGTVVLGASNNFAGLTVNAGAAGYTNGYAFGTGTLTLANGVAVGQSGGMAAVTGNDRLDRSLASDLLLQGNVTFGVGNSATHLGGDVDLGGSNRTLTLVASTLLYGDVSSGGLLLVNGSATQSRSFSLFGMNTYNGGTVVGTNLFLQVGSDNALGTGNVVFSNTSTGTAGLRATTLSTNLVQLRTISNNIVLGSGMDVSVDGAASVQDSIGTPVAVTVNMTLSGVISGQGSLTKNTSNTVTLTGANTYSGGTTISNGTVSVSADNNLGTAPGSPANNITFSGGKLLATSGFTLHANRSINIGTPGGAIQVASGQNLAHAGLISGTGSLAKSGAGTLTLSGASTYSGGTTLSEGVLRLDSTNAAGTGLITQSSGASTLEINTTGTVTNEMNIFNVSTLQTVTLSGAKTLNNMTYIVASGTTTTDSGDLSGTGGITKAGSGTLVLSGSNSYTGGTSISNGAVSISADNNLGAVPAWPSAGNVTFDLGKLLVTESFTLNSNRGLAMGAFGGSIEVATGKSFAYEGVAAGSGALTKSGNGTLSLSGANTYTGATTLSAGTLELANTSGEALGSTASLGVASGATLLVSQSNQVNNSASVSLSGGTITRASGVSETFGALNVTHASSLDFGGGASGNMTFGSYTPSSLLTVNNFFGGNTLVFGNDISSYLAVGTYDTTSFSNAYFTINSISGGFTTSYSGGSFTITAIPEASTYAAAVGLLGLMLWPLRRRGVSIAKRF